VSTLENCYDILEERLIPGRELERSAPFACCCVVAEYLFDGVEQRQGLSFGPMTAAAALLTILADTVDLTCWGGNKEKMRDYVPA